MSIVSQTIWNLLAFWHKAMKGSICLETGEEAVKYHYGKCPKILNTKVWQNDMQTMQI